MYSSALTASKYYNVHPETLRDWANSGKIPYKKTAGGHRRYLLQPENDEPGEQRDIVYARVSSRKQDRDLERQTNFLRRKYPNYEVITDIGSGLNFKRQGFRKILESLFEGNIREVIVSSSDRFSRFGTREFFGWLFEYFGAKLTILNNSHYKNPNEELSEDLLEIITVFSARYHGRRNYKNNKEDQDLS